MAEKPEMVELQFTDLTGALRSIDVSQERFDNAVKLGKVFVTQVENAVRIRTGDRDNNAV
jgi:glutamine synthetase